MPSAWLAWSVDHMLSAHAAATASGDITTKG
jgi:hypothetical protein